MADPVTVLAIVNGSAGLILKCVSVVKSLHEVAGKHQKAGIAVMSLVSEVDTIELAWIRIKEWAEGYSKADTVDTELLNRMNRSLECGTLVMSALQNDISDYEKYGSKLSFRQRSKAVWNERALQDHQNRVRGQAVAMSLLLQVLKLPTLEGQSKLLQESNHVFQDSDESAYSIVPSRWSLSTQSFNARDSMEITDLVYRRLSFEEDLFAGRVYKRRYGNPLIHSVFRRNLEPVSKHQEGEHSNAVLVPAELLSTRGRRSSYPKARLQMETEKLRRVEHRHLAQPEKSFQSNDHFKYTRFGITLQSAATTDLERILNRYHEGDRGASDRLHFHDVLRYHLILTAFGCLSRGLAHLHGLDLIHGDIRPANILYQNYRSLMFTDRFVWALAGNGTHLSHAIGRSSQYFGSYAPREENISNDGEFPSEDHASHPEGNQSLNVSGSKSMDIFSLGCVILQVLSVLVGEDSGNKFRSFAPFGRNIDKIHAWIEEQIQRDYPDDLRVTIRMIFKLGMRMTQADPKRRPLIDEVLDELTTAGPQFFCSRCFSQPKGSMTESAQS